MRQKITRFLSFGFLIGYFAILIAEPVYTSEATLSRLLFFGKALFPSLFISLCLSGILVTAKPTRFLYRFPFGMEFTVWALGCLCGFPVGARSAFLLYEQGQISKRRAEFLCSFSNLASLPFLTGVVGGALFHNPALGLQFALLQAASALLTAAVLFLWLHPACPGVVPGQATDEQTLANAIGRSAHIMIELGGMLIFFGVAADVIVRVCGLSGWIAACIQGFLEFSTGCAQAAALGGNAGVLLAAACIGFSGLCVGTQIRAVTQKKLSLRPYWFGKLLQTAFMVLFSWFLLVNS